jgi:cytochrome c5
VSGIFRAIYEVGDVANLIDTPYGVVLLGKLALLIPIMGIAALNLLVVERQMRTAVRMIESETAIQHWVQLIRRTVGFEIGGVLLILLLTGILTSLAPARETFGAGMVVRGEVDDLRILVAITPGVPGLNTFDIYVKDNLNRPIPESRKVALNITMKNHEMGIQEVVGEQVELGHYTLSGGYVSMIGMWEMEVLVRRGGQDDARLVLGLPMLSLELPQNGLKIVSSSSLLIGLELLAFGLILLLSTQRLERARAGAGIVAQFSAGIVIVGCVFAIANALNSGENGILALHNPVPTDNASIARGQKIYQSMCTACHGSTGLGDGPVATNLKPPPANLQIHMRDGHPDGFLYNWITNGVSGSAMPAFGNSLTELERWDVINFIRTFAYLVR